MYACFIEVKSFSNKENIFSNILFDEIKLFLINMKLSSGNNKHVEMSFIIFNNKY